METRKTIVAISIVMLAVFALADAALAATVCVPDDYSTIQAAINNVNANDTIKVCEGTYTLTAQIDVNIAVTLEGGYDSATCTTRGNVTTIDGDESVRCFYVTADATIDGFTITDGYVSGTGDGAGVYITGTNAATINNCIISNCDAGDDGGGIWNNDGASQVSNCVLSNNTAGDNGGGIWNDDGASDVSDCVLSGNVAGDDGGGIYSDGAPDVDRCVFYQNTAGDDGGGIYNDYGADPDIRNCAFAENTAGAFGGGICNDGSGYGSACTDIENCTFYNNSAYKGGAIHNEDDADVEMGNSILWGNSATTSGGEIYNNSDFSHMDVWDCDIEGCINGTKCGGEDSHDEGGNICVDPQFCATGNLDGNDDSWATCDDGLALQSDSPCVDTCDSASSDYDLCGKDRDLGDDPDMGAYEMDPSDNCGT